MLQGRVSFEHGGRLLRLLGFGSAEAWPNRRSVVNASLESFRVLTDRSKLDVQPARIRVVTVPRETDLELSSDPSRERAHADEVRLLNRLEGNATLPVGRILKIPVGVSEDSGGSRRINGSRKRLISLFLFWSGS